MLLCPVRVVLPPLDRVAAEIAGSDPLVNLKAYGDKQYLSAVAMILSGPSVTYATLCKNYE
jgi:hypothetical protein